MSDPSSLNLWNYKPWWCQPWSILLTGIILISISWIILKILWITIAVSFLIFLWWYYFLILWPKLISMSGILDKKSQYSLEEYEKMKE